MRSFGVVQINLSGPHLYGNGETLDDLARALTNDMDADNSFFRPLYDELEHGGFLVMLIDHAEIEGLE